MAELNDIGAQPLRIEPSRIRSLPASAASGVPRGTRMNPITTVPGGRFASDRYRSAYEMDQEVQDQGVTFSDYAKSIMSGFAGIGNIATKGVGWLARQVGQEDLGRSIETLGTRAVDYWHDSLSDAAKAEAAKSFIVRNEHGEFEWGDAGLQTALLAGAESIPGTLVGAGIGGALTKVLQVFANPFGRKALFDTASRLADPKWVAAASPQAVTRATQAAKKLRFVDQALGVAGFGAGEGMVGAPFAAVNVYDQVMRLPQEKLEGNTRYQQVYNTTDPAMGEAARHRYAAETVAREAATEAGFQAGITTALLGAPMGAFFGRVIGKTGRMGSSRLAASLTGFAGEAAQESAQSAAEAVISGRQINELGGDIDLLESAINQAVGGAAAGGMLGGAVGAASFRPEGGAQRRDEGKPDDDKMTPQRRLMEVGREALQAGVPLEDIEGVIRQEGVAPLGKVATIRRMTAEAKQRAEAAAQQQPAPPPQETTRSRHEPFRPTETVPQPPPEPPDDASGGAAARYPHTDTRGERYRTLMPGGLTDDATEQVDPFNPERVYPKTPIRNPDADAIDVEQQAHQAAASPMNDQPLPTERQDEAENYKVGRVEGERVGLPKLRPAVEYPKGAERHGITMRSHYGRFTGTMGGDGQALDFFMGEADNDRVYLFHHYDPQDRFTQHKALVNFESREAAEAELKHFYRGEMPGDVVELTKEQFQQWTEEADTSVPYPGAPQRQARIARQAGASQVAVTPAGRQVAVQYELRDADELIVSHTEKGETNPRFPRALQPRDRERAGMRQWITETASRFQPALAVQGAGVGEGAPVIAADGVVESGNGRVALVQSIYRQGKADAYRQYLKENAAQFGLTPEQVDQIKKPVLVRVRTQPMNFEERRAFAGEANRPSTARYSPAETARSDAGNLSDADLQMFAPSESGNVLAASNQGFLNAFLAKMPAAERAELTTSDGKPTKQLADRIQAAIFAKAYDNEQLTRLAAEEADPDVKTVLASLMRAAPVFAQAKAAGADTSMVVDPLLEAVEVIRNSRNQRQSLDEHLSQQLVPYDPGVERMARFIDTHMRSAKRMSEGMVALGEYLEQNALDANTDDMFGAPPPPSLETAFEQANRALTGMEREALFSRIATVSEFGVPGPATAMFSRRGVRPGDRIKVPGAAASALEQYALPEVAKGGAAAPGYHLISQAYDGRELTLQVPESAEAIEAMAEAVLESAAQARDVEQASLNTLATRLRDAAQGAKPIGDMFGEEGGGTQATLFDQTQVYARRAPAPDQIDLFAVNPEPPAGWGQAEPEADPVGPVDNSVLAVRGPGTAHAGDIATHVENALEPEDAASIVAPFRRYAQENMVVLALDENDKPIGLFRHTIGGIASAPVHIGHLMGAVHNLPGVRKVWLAHNHPSGGIEQSAADHNITRLMASHSQETGIETLGMLVVGPNQKEATVYRESTEKWDNPGTWREKRIQIRTGGRKRGRVPVLERVARRVEKWTGGAISTPSKMEEAARILSGDYESEGIVLMDNRHVPVGWVPMTSAEMRNLRTGQVGTGASRLLQEIDRRNAAVMVARMNPVPSGRTPPAATNLGNFLTSTEVRLLDVLFTDRSVSQAQKGGMPIGGERYFSRGGGAEQAAEQPEPTMQEMIRNEIRAAFARAAGIEPDALSQPAREEAAAEPTYETDPRHVVNPIPPDASPDAKVDQLHALARENQQWVQPVLDEINERLGTTGNTDIKTRASILGKAERPSIQESKPWWGIEHIRDSFRFRTVIDSLDQIEPALGIFFGRAAESGHSVEIVKADFDKMESPLQWGWRMVAFDLRMPNGQIAEYQLSIKELVEANDGGLHKLFEKWRRRDINSLNEQEFEDYRRDVETSVSTYSAAWQAALDRAGQTEAEAFASLSRARAFVSSSTVSKSPVSSPVSGVGNEPRGNQVPSTRSAENEPSMTSTREPSSGFSVRTTTGESISQDSDPVDNRSLFSRAQTSTPEFRQWFGDSKVVDENGEPRVVYHGTADDFDTFEVNAGGASGQGAEEGGLFFGLSPDTASVFARLATRQGRHGAGNVMPVYLSIQNPKRVGIHDVMRMRGDFDEWTHDPAKMRRAIEQAKAEGHDGLYIDEYSEWGHTDWREEGKRELYNITEGQWVAFDPAQVKSAVGNQGTFDAGNPNILMSRGQPGSPAPRAGWMREAVAGMNLERLSPLLRVRFVQTADQLPGGAPADVEGAYFHDGTIYFVESNLRPETFGEKFAHEVMGHLAIERDPAFEPVIRGVRNAINVGNREVMELVAEVQSRQGMLPKDVEAREVLALMAERGGSESKLWQRYTDALGTFATQTRLLDPTSLSQAQLRRVLRTAARNMERDARIARDFAAAAGSSEAVRTLRDKADPTDQEIIEGLRALDQQYRSQGLYSMPAEEDIDELVEEYGRPAQSSIDAERAFNNGARVFAGSEQAEGVREITDAKELGNYTSDLLMIVEQGLFSRSGGSLTPAERRFFDEMRGNPENWRELTEAVPGISYENGQLVVPPESTEAMAEYVDETVTLERGQGNDRLPPSFYNGRFAYRFGGMYARAGAMPAGIDPAVEEISRRTMAPAPEDLSLMDRARKFIRELVDIDTDSVVQGVIDDANAIKQLERDQFGRVLDASESAYKATLATRNLASVMVPVMLRGSLTYRDGSFQIRPGTKGVVEIFRRLTDHADGNLLHLWENYASARRAADLRAKGRPHQPYTSSDIDTLLALEQQYPEFREVLDDWTEFNNAHLDLLVELGVLDGDMVEVWKQNVYAPWYRILPDAETELQGPFKHQSMSGHGGQRIKKRLKAQSDLPIGNVFENMMMNTAYMIDEAFKNEAMRRIVQLGENVAMTRVDLPWESVNISNSQIESALKKQGIVVGNIVGGELGRLSADQRAGWTKLFRRYAPTGPNIVSYYEGGKPVYFEVHDPLLLRSIGAMGAQNTKGLLDTLFHGSKRLLTGAVTLDPAFMAANLMRDTLSTFVVAGQPGMKPVIDALKGAKDAFVQNDDIMEIMAAGGGGGGYYDMQPADLRKFLVNHLGSESAARRFENSVVHPKGLYSFWRRVSSAAENANRVAVYKAVRKNGGSVAEAAYQARDVLNFTMRGDYAAVRWLTMSVPFMNARIQGLYRLARGAKSDPRAFVIRGSLILAATAALMLRNNDRDEYEELPEWDRDTYWHVFLNPKGTPVGEGDHWRIPKPFEAGIIFGTAPERVFRLMSGRDTKAIALERAADALGETLAMNPIPQLAKPLVEQFANKSFFTDRPIVGFREQYLPAEAQYGPWTSETARAAAEVLPDWAPEGARSPQRLEHLVRSYLGATGMYVLGASDIMARKLGPYPERPAAKLSDRPVLRRFLQPSVPRSTKYADELYSLLNEADGIFRAVNTYREQGRLEEARELAEENRSMLAARRQLRSIANQVTALNRQQRRILTSDLTPQEKRRQIEEIQRRRNETVARVRRYADL